MQIGDMSFWKQRKDWLASKYLKKSSSLYLGGQTKDAIRYLVCALLQRPVLVIEQILQSTGF